MSASDHRYLIALGSNRRHPRFGRPQAVLAKAVNEIDEMAGKVVACSPIVASAPVGPSLRQYANATLVLQSGLGPRALLDRLQEVETAFGRKRMGQTWRERVLDLDIVLWSGGMFAEPDLVIPHPLFRQRNFVLGPATAVAPQWRDPVSGLSLRQLHSRLTRNRPVPR